MFNSWKRLRPQLPVVGGMATMPSRLGTLIQALASILPQVDRLYLYLDGHAAVPAAASGDEKIVPILSSSDPGLHANGKFLPMELAAGDFLFAGFDDDIAYPPRYTATLAKALQGLGGEVVAGYHGVMLADPFVRYRTGRTVFHFTEGLPANRVVDVLGTGTVMFSAEKLRFDFRAWREINMIDLNLAVEAGLHDKRLVCLKRGPGFLRMLSENQPDSCYSLLLDDDTEHTRLARQVLALNAQHAAGSRQPGRSLSYR